LTQQIFLFIFDNTQYFWIDLEIQINIKTKKNKKKDLTSFASAFAARVFAKNKERLKHFILIIPLQIPVFCSSLA
jgi:hypothetical protein